MSGRIQTLLGHIAVVVASAVCLVDSPVQAGPPCNCGRDHLGPCTLGPTPYGYYPAQWRRWPTDEAVVAQAPATWRPGAAAAPRLAPHPPQHRAPMGAGKHSPEQLFEEEIPSLPPRGQAAPPAAPRTAPRTEDPFKDDTTSTTPYLPHAPSATPAAAPRPWHVDTDDKEVHAAPRGPAVANPYAGRPRAMSSINPLEDDLGLQEQALVENKRSIVPASRTAPPQITEIEEAVPAAGNPLRSMPANSIRAESGSRAVSIDEIDPEREEARLNSSSEPQLLPAARDAAPLPATESDEPAEEAAPPATPDGEPQLIEPATHAQATDQPAAESTVVERSAPIRWRESDVVRSGFTRPKSTKRPLANASEGASSNPLRGSSTGAANPLR